ncbi:helix-turn-helix transcriptional regulator [Agrobacterium rubi]|nr:helix-turn-helix transcriptional regulator [Agrobacterium rubi]NTF24789.1 helix-turn-helix transcriptional regulator [Agrobacterium rubi]
MPDDIIKLRITDTQDQLVADIGMRIKKMRMDRQMTQQMLADELGLSRAAVTQWESGQATCSFAQALELEVVFGTDVGYILYGRRYGKIQNPSDAARSRREVIET